MRMRGGERGIANAYEKDRSNNATGLFRHRIEKQFVRQRRYFKILHRVSTRGCCFSRRNFRAPRFLKRFNFIN